VVHPKSKYEKKRDFATPNGPMKKSKVSLVDFVMSLIVFFTESLVLSPM
jgi:hypothetical protein